LLGSDGLLPVIFEHQRIAQITRDFLLQLRLRHHRIERWLGIRALFWPDAMKPVNFLNRSLISDTISESQRGALLLRSPREAAEGSQPRREVRRSVRQIKSRRKSDKAAEKKDRGRRVANFVRHRGEDFARNAI